MKIVPARRREPAPLDLGAAFEDLGDRMFDWDRVLDGGRLASRLPAAFRARPMPPLDVSETEDAIRVTLDAPGLEVKDFDVEVMVDRLVISGERKWSEEEKGEEFHRVESRYGAFERSIRLPSNLRLDPDAIQAKYAKGVLEVTVPKVERTPAKRIPVEKA